MANYNSSYTGAQIDDAIARVITAKNAGGIVNGNSLSTTLNSYLTTANASSTYLTKTDAASTYLKKTDASSTYLTQTNAASTYLTQTNAASTYYPKQNLTILTNKEVAVSDWAADTTYAAYPYRATIAATGITANHYCEVIFSLADATSGYFAPICESIAGGIYIYASSIPLAAITIPTIKCTLA